MIRKVFIFVAFSLLFLVYNPESIHADVGFEFPNMDNQNNMRGICNSPTSCISGSKTYTIQWLGMESGDEPITLSMQEDVKDNLSIEIGKITNLTKNTRTITIDNLVVRDSLDLKREPHNVYDKKYSFLIHKDTDNYAEYRVIQTDNILNIIRIKNQTIKFSVIREGEIKNVESIPFILTANGVKSSSLRTKHNMRQSRSNYSFITNKYDEKNKPYVFDIITEDNDLIKIEKKIVNDSEFTFYIRPKIQKIIPLKGENVNLLTGEIILVNDKNKEIKGILKDGNVIFEDLETIDLETVYKLKRFNLDNSNLTITLDEVELKNITQINVERYIDKVFSIEWGPNILNHPDVKEFSVLDIYLLQNEQPTHIKQTVDLNQSNVTFKVNASKNPSLIVGERDKFFSVSTDSKLYIDRIIQPLHFEIEKAFKPKKEEDDVFVEVIKPLSANKINPEELLDIEGFILHESPKTPIKMDNETLLSIDSFVIREEEHEEPKNILLPEIVFMDGYSIDDQPSFLPEDGYQALLQREIIKRKNIEQILEQDRKNRIAYEVRKIEFEEQFKPKYFDLYVDGNAITPKVSEINSNNPSGALKDINRVTDLSSLEQTLNLIDVQGSIVENKENLFMIPSIDSFEISDSDEQHHWFEESDFILNAIENEKKIRLEAALRQDLDNRLRHEREVMQIMRDLEQMERNQSSTMESAIIYEITGPKLMSETQFSPSSLEAQTNDSKQVELTKVNEMGETSKIEHRRSHSLSPKTKSIKTNQNFDENDITGEIIRDKHSVLPNTGQQKERNKLGITLIILGICVLLSKREKNTI